MTGDTDALAARLRSTDARLVGAAIDELHARLLTLDTVPIPPPPPDVAEVLRGAAGSADIEDSLVRYLKVFARYPFDPPLSDAHRVARSVETVLHGGSYAARALSLRLPASDDLVPALRYLAERGVRSKREEDQAGWLLTYLLDDESSRATTARLVRSWQSDPGLDRVVAKVPEGMAAAERGTSGSTGPDWLAFRGARRALEPPVLPASRPGATVMSDVWHAYDELARRDRTHATVNHLAKDWAHCLTSTTNRHQRQLHLRIGPLVVRRLRRSCR